jgi:Glycosyltransferase family 92
VKIILFLSISGTYADEHQGIVEWVVYHWALGVSRFYIRDDGSEPPMQELLQPFIDSGLVMYHYGNDSVPGTQQHRHYNEECISRYKNKHTFMRKCPCLSAACPQVPLFRQ